MNILLKRLCVIVAATGALAAAVNAQTNITVNAFNSGNTDGFLDRLTLGAVPAPSGPESTLSAVSGGASVSYVRGSGTPTGFRAYYGAEMDANPSYQSSIFNITFDFRQLTGADTEVNFMDSGLTQGAQLIFRSSAIGLGGNTLKVRDASGWADTGVVIQSGDTPEFQSKWYNVSLTVVPENNAGTDTFDLVVSDETGLVHSGNYTFRNNLTSYNVIEWRSLSSNSASEFAVDNVAISVVPEPSTFAFLLGLAALGLVYYRRRK